MKLKILLGNLLEINSKNNQVKFVIIEIKNK